MAQFNAHLPIVLADVVRVYIRGVDEHSGVWQTHIDYKDDLSTPVFVQADLADFNSAFRAACLLAIRNCLTTTNVVQTIAVESRRDVALFPEIFGALAPGTVIFDTMPPFVQATIRLQTDIRGKRGRGRMMMPGVPENFSDSGILNATAYGAYNALLPLLQGPIATTTPSRSWFPVISKRDTYSDQTQLWTLRMRLLTSLSIRPELGTQDRRKIGRGA